MDPNERLQAYLHARYVQAFRRLLWARLGVGLLVWIIVALAITLSWTGLFVGVAVLAMPAIWALSYEWHASSDFHSDLRQSPIRIVRSGTSASRTTSHPFE